MEIKFTQGDSVAIPEGCTAEIKDGIITFSPQQEPEQNFKDGDVLIDDFKSSTMYPHKIIFIYKGKRILENYEAYVHRSLSGSLIFNDSCCGLDRCKVRLATEEEKQELFDALKEKGLYWNAEMKRVERLRGRSEEEDLYWYIGGLSSIYRSFEHGTVVDDERYESGNYFRSRGEAARFLDIIKESLRKFHQDDQL